MTRLVELSDPSGVAHARRVATTLAAECGFDEQDSGRVALVVTEVATNVVKHAGTGTLLLTSSRHDPIPVLDVVAVDKGRGFDVGRSVRDGHSTAGTPGEGLGAIIRLSDAFDAYSLPDAGSVVFARLVKRHPAEGNHGRSAFLVSGISVAMPGEEVCGDAWAYRAEQGRLAVLVADGIGHGPQAAEASALAVRVLPDVAGGAPDDAVQRIHEALRPTRGATVAMAVVDATAGEVRYCGIGNIAAVVLSDGPPRHLVSQNGTAGREARRIQLFRYPWVAGSLLVMASDGLGTRWDLSAYPGAFTRHPAILAGLLFRDFSRTRDDVTVVVAREAPEWRP